MKNQHKKSILLQSVLLKNMPIMLCFFVFDIMTGQSGSTSPYFSSSDVSIQGGAFTPYVKHAGRLMMAIGIIVFLYAAIKTYNNWQSGQTGIFAQVQNMLLGAFALIIVGVFINAFFGI